MKSRISTLRFRRVFNCILLFSLLLSGLYAGNVSAARAQQPAGDTPTGPAKAIKTIAETAIDKNAVLNRLIEFYGVSPDSGASIQSIAETESILFGTFVIPSAVDRDSGPSAHYFIATQNANATTVTPEYTEQFVSGLERLYLDGLVSQDLLAIFSMSAQGDGSSQLSLPWLSGSNATFTNGPHADGFQPAPNVLSALDFVPGDNKVRAARDGFAQQIVCTGQTQSSWIWVTHADGWRTSYYHVINAQVTTSGRQVGRGEYLGDLATNSTDALRCGGSWTGAHVHIALLRNGSQVAIQGVDIGGWTVGGSGVSGTMTRISDGTIRYANASSGSRTVYNDGTIGSGGGGGACSGPSLSSPSDGYVSSNQTITFSWSALSGCTFNGYTFRIKDTSSMDSGGTTIDDRGVGPTSWTQTIGSEWNNRDLYWGVRAANAPNGGSWSVRRFRIEPGGGGCNPNADQVGFYVDPNYGGSCVVKGIGNYPDPGSMGVPNDSLSSIRVGGNVKLTLCRDNDYANTCETFTGDDPNLADNSIGEQSSSAKVEARAASCTGGATPGPLLSGYNYCAEEGGTCSFSGQASVAYGANNCYLYLTLTDGAACGNGVFGDPLVGAHKDCYSKILASPPSAEFDAWPVTGSAPFNTALHIVNMSNISSCSWNYGDGQTSTTCTQLHDHVYNNAGTYTVSLTVSGPGGSNSMTRQNYITVSQPPLTAPTGVGATDGLYTDKVQIFWNSSGGATSYQVYRNTSDSSSGASVVGSPSGSPYDDTSATPGTTYWYFVKACNSGGCSGYSASDSGYAASATTGNDDFDSPKWIAGIPYSDVMDTTSATQAADDPALIGCSRAAGLASVWYRYTPPTNGPLVLDTLGSSYDTMIGIWTGWRGSLTEVGCNDDAGSSYQSQLTLPVTAGTSYYIGISQYNNSSFGASTTEIKRLPQLSSQGGGTLQFHANVPALSTTYRSVGTYDGLILESGENTNVGGNMNFTAETFNLGDDGANKQYRSILSFNTASLPDNAVITGANLRIRWAGVVGRSWFGTLGNILVDVRTGSFGLGALQLTDFQAVASKNGVLSITNTPDSNGWYSKRLASANFMYINKTGVTQFRLRFTKDDDNDRMADYVKFYSGNYTVAADRPALVITYTLP